MSLAATTTCTTLAEAIHDGGRLLCDAGNWPLIAPAPDPHVLDSLLRARESFCASLERCSQAEAETVMRASLFTLTAIPERAGLVGQRGAAAQERIAAAHAIMASGWSHPLSRHAFLIAALHTSAYELPLMSDLHRCAEITVERYLTWLFRRPVFRADGDDARYVRWLVTMLTWLRDRVRDKKLQERRALILAQILHQLDIGMVIYSDVCIRAVLDARARLIETVTAQAPSLHGTNATLPDQRAPGSRIRLGFMIRTLMNHPDPLAFCSQFEHFDQQRYEIILYSHDIADRQCAHDIALYQRMFGFVSAIRSLNGLSVRQMVDAVRADALDIFVYSYAARIGASGTDCLVSAPLARVQVVMNSFVPMATGLPSFTHVATVRPHQATRASLLSECRESLAEIPTVLISYPPATPTTPDRIITRQTLGIPANAPVFYNGGAVDKIVPILARAWVRALARTPGSYLMLAPFNPGWTGVQGAVNLWALLNEVCRAENVDRARIIVLRELSPRDTRQLLEIATVALGTFPHGSSTSVALALQAGVPVVTRRSPWLRGTGDASLVESIGLTALVATDADAYVDLAVRLAGDAAWNGELRLRIRAGLPTAPFLSSHAYGRGLQGMFDRLAYASFGYPLPAGALTERAA
jgi:predicted O-linked N-acetylglucosamine transferase (SPINDLY family)